MFEKRLKNFGAIFIASIFAKKTNKLVFIYSIRHFNLKVLNVSFSTVLFFKAVRKNKNKIKTSHLPQFSHNLDETLKIYLVWP